MYYSGAVVIGDYSDFERRSGARWPNERGDCSVVGFVGSPAEAVFVELKSSVVTIEEEDGAPSSSMCRGTQPGSRPWRYELLGTPTR